MSRRYTNDLKAINGFDIQDVAGQKRPPRQFTECPHLKIHSPRNVWKSAIEDSTLSLVPPQILHSPMSAEHSLNTQYNLKASMTVPLVLRYWVKLVHIVDESITQGGAGAGKLLKHCTTHRLLCSTTVPYPCTSFLIHSHSLLRVKQSVIITPTRRHGTLQDRDCQGSQQKGHTGGGVGEGWDRMKTLKRRAGFPKKNQTQEAKHWSRKQPL